MMIKSVNIILLNKSLRQGDSLFDGSDELKISESFEEASLIPGIAVSERIVRGNSCSVDTLFGLISVVIMRLNLGRVSRNTHHITSSCQTSYQTSVVIHVPIYNQITGFKSVPWDGICKTNLKALTEILDMCSLFYMSMW